MNMTDVRLLIIGGGILLPYVARVPGAILRGPEWLTDYFGSFLLLGAFNALCWGTILLSTLPYRRPVSCLFPIVAGFGFTGLLHGTLDLSSDAQAAIALVFIPIYSVPIILVAAVAGFVVDRWVPTRISETAAH